MYRRRWRLPWSSIFTPSVWLFKPQRLPGDLHPMMYDLFNDAYFLRQLVSSEGGCLLAALPGHADIAVRSCRISGTRHPSRLEHLEPQKTPRSCWIDKHWGSDAMCCMADVADYKLLGDQSVKHRWEGIPYLLRDSLACDQELLAFARA